MADPGADPAGVGAGTARPVRACRASSSRGGVAQPPRKREPPKKRGRPRAQHEPPKKRGRPRAHRATVDTPQTTKQRSRRASTSPPPPAREATRQAVRDAAAWLEQTQVRDREQRHYDANYLCGLHPKNVLDGPRTRAKPNSAVTSPPALGVESAAPAAEARVAAANAIIDLNWKAIEDDDVPARLSSLLAGAAVAAAVAGDAAAADDAAAAADAAAAKAAGDAAAALAPPAAAIPAAEAAPPAPATPPSFSGCIVTAPWGKDEEYPALVLPEDAWPAPRGKVAIAWLEWAGGSVAKMKSDMKTGHVRPELIAVAEGATGPSAEEWVNVYLRGYLAWLPAIALALEERRAARTLAHGRVDVPRGLLDVPTYAALVCKALSLDVAASAAWSAGLARVKASGTAKEATDATVAMRHLIGRAARDDDDVDCPPPQALAGLDGVRLFAAFDERWWKRSARAVPLAERRGHDRLVLLAENTYAAPVCKSNLQTYFNVRVIECFDASSSAVLRELDESNRFVQKSAKSTSI